MIRWMRVLLKLLLVVVVLGIIGLGSIGREVVKRARAFDMRIVAHDP